MDNLAIKAFSMRGDHDFNLHDDATLVEYNISQLDHMLNSYVEKYGMVYVLMFLTVFCFVFSFLLFGFLILLSHLFGCKGNDRHCNENDEGTHNSRSNSANKLATGHKPRAGGGRDLEIACISNFCLANGALPHEQLSLFYENKIPSIYPEDEMIWGDSKEKLIKVHVVGCVDNTQKKQLSNYQTNFHIQAAPMAAAKMMYLIKVAANKLRSEPNEQPNDGWNENRSTNNYYKFIEAKMPVAAVAA